MADYYVRRHAAPLVMSLSLAPLFLALRAILGGAPSVMVFRWLVAVAHYAGGWQEDIAELLDGLGSRNGLTCGR